MNLFAPDVSVVIPVFNRANWLVRAVKSCFDQSCMVEVIVVDDGSSEDIRSTLESNFQMQLSANRSPCIKLFRQANKGASAARNAGLAQSSGEFVKFLDSDDELLTGVLAKEIRGAREKRCDVLLTGWEERFFREDGTEDISRRHKRPTPDLSHGIDDMLMGRSPWTSAALYRKAFIKKLRWNPAWRLADDWGWALTVCLAGAKFHSLDIISCAYNQHGGVRMTDGGRMMLRPTRARQSMLRMVEDELRRQGALTAERQRKLAQYYYRDCQVLAEYDSAEWQRIWAHCVELCPKFLPTEPNRIVRHFCYFLGVRRGVAAYVRAQNVARRLGLLGRTTSCPIL